VAARLIYTYINPTKAKDIELACSVMNNDGIIAYPTDVNWALAFSPKSPQALEKIQRLKPNHPAKQPYSLLCSDLSMASQIGLIDNTNYHYLKKALPGPYTVILNCNRSIPRHLRDTRKVVGIRIPDSPLVLELVRAFDGPIATTSLPKHTEDIDAPPLKFGYEILEHFGNQIDLILDLGDESLGLETTIISCVDGSPELIRAGYGDPKAFGLQE
jgi:tRNA threonylcarbamoyl adenosine modification protein (Sua5/YciO/YrdC/YwlC family)